MKLWSAVSTAVFSIALIAAMLPTAASATATAPPAPTAVAGTHGSTGQIDITWTAPSFDGGAAITKYTAVASPDGSSCEDITLTPGSLGCNILVTNGSSYTVTVTATNSAGTSVASSASAAIPAGLAPAIAIPTVAGTGIAGEAAVSWTAATALDSWSVTGYTVQAYSESGGLVAEAGKTCSETALLTCTIPGLAGSATHWFRVKATTGAGSTWSDVSASGGFTPDGVPDQVTGLGLTPGINQIKADWTAPTAGTAPTSYTVVAMPGGANVTVLSTAVTATILGLTNGVSYSIEVMGNNANGTGASQAATVSEVPFTAPAAPTNVKILNVSDTAIGDLIVGWTVPANDGGLAITKYTVTVTGSTYTPATCVLTDPTANTCTLHGASPLAATDLLPVTVKVKAENTSTSSATSATSAVGYYGNLPGASTPAVAPANPPAPGEPRNVALEDVAGTSGELLASWATPKSNGGSAVTGYVVTYGPNTTDTALQGTQACTTAALSCNLTGLNQMKNYSIQVKATNSSGTGNPSVDITAVNPIGVPGAVLNLVASGVTATTANIAWAAPSDLGGLVGAAGAITYVVTSTNGTVTYTTGTTATLASLTGAATVTVHAVAATAISGAPGSGIDTPVSFTPSATPGAPQNLKASAGGAATVLLTWDDPVVVGTGTPTFAITGASGTITPASVAGSGGPYSVTVTSTPALVDGNLYNFTVTSMADATVGGSASASGKAGALLAGPSAPTITVGVGSTPGSIDVGWVAVTGATGYVATALDGSTPTAFTCEISSTGCSITGLTAGTTYGVQVATKNANGTGPAVIADNGEPLTAVAIGLSVEATSVKAVAGDGQVVLTWVEPVPADAAANPFVNVSVSQSPSPSSTGIAFGTLTYTAGSLTNGTEYTFYVKAVNGAGTTAGVMVTATPAAAPGIPTGVSATAGNASATVSWTAPPASGGAAVTDYEITATPISGGTMAVSLKTGSSATAGTIGGLLNGATYEIQVAAISAGGTGTASTSTTADNVTPAAVPTAPTGATATAGTSNATVNWVASTFGGGLAITSYKVTATPGGASCQTTGAIGMNCVVGGLLGVTAYSFDVVATNAAGDSLAATATATTLRTGAVLDTTVNHTFGDIGTVGTEAAAAIAALYNTTPAITQGMTTTTYGPLVPVNRANMAVFLSRSIQAVGHTVNTTVNHTFADVAGLTAEQQSSIAAIGNTSPAITNGRTAISYDPGSTVSRQEMAAFLSRTWQSLGGTCDSTVNHAFTDVGTSFAQAEIACVNNLGIANGTTTTTFEPAAPVNRLQMALFLFRLVDASVAQGL